MAETEQSPRAAAGGHQVADGFVVTGELYSQGSHDFTKADGTAFTRWSAAILVHGALVYVSFFDEAQMAHYLHGVPERSVVRIPVRLRAYVNKGGQPVVGLDAERPL
jgi:hypothetical protein